MGVLDQGQHRTERVVFETEWHRISGLLTLSRDGYRSRVSDLLNAGERDFVTLTDATVERFDDGGSVQHAFLVVARRYIVLAIDSPG